MKLLNFENFKKLESIREEVSIENFDELVEETAALWEGEQILNEGFSSSIMQMLLNSDVKERYRKNFAAELNKKFGVAVSDIQDTDFQLLTDPGLAFQRPIKGDDNKLVFMINDDTELRDKWSSYQQGRAPFPFLVGIVRGGVNCWYGFTKEPTGFGRSQLSKTDRYGILAKDIYAKSSYFPKGSPIPNPTAKAYTEFSTKAYVLDLNSIQEKYSTGPKVQARKEARKGAAALITAKKVKEENLARYKEIIAKKVGPADTLKKFQTIWTKGLNGITAWINSTKLEDLEVVKNYGNFDFGGWNRQDIGSTLQQLYRSYGEYIRDYVEFARYEKRVEILSKAIETGKNPENGEDLTPENISNFQGTVEWIRKDLERFPIKCVEYNQHFDKCDKQITIGVEQLKTLLGPDKSAFPVNW
jgi:hypothetical protein